jgi:hypothetical protein
MEAGPLAGIAIAGAVRSEAPKTSDVASAIFFIEISVGNAPEPNAEFHWKFRARTELP